RRAPDPAIVPAAAGAGGTGTLADDRSTGGGAGARGAVLPRHTPAVAGGPVLGRRLRDGPGGGGRSHAPPADGHRPARPRGGAVGPGPGRVRAGAAAARPPARPLGGAGPLAAAAGPSRPPPGGAGGTRGGGGVRELPRQRLADADPAVRA